MAGAGVEARYPRRTSPSWAHETAEAAERRCHVEWSQAYPGPVRTSVTSPKALMTEVFHPGGPHL